MDRETMIRMFDFSSETMETRIQQQNDSFKVLKKINNSLSYQQKILQKHLEHKDIFRQS